MASSPCAAAGAATAASRSDRGMTPRSSCSAGSNECGLPGGCQLSPGRALAGGRRSTAKNQATIPPRLVLHLLLPDRPVDGAARAALRGRRVTSAMGWSPDQPLVSLREVHKSFRSVAVLTGVSFDVAKGEVVCIIGPSGSGKSTLLRCINALVPIDRGSILVEGQEQFLSQIL
jgi:ABC-type glutathione transport system ATPase component